DGYWEWNSYQCRRCDSSCSQCSGPGLGSCTLCHALNFLSPKNWEDAEGPCVTRCPPGMFAHPPSRRCRRPPLAPVKTFYMQFQFRMGFQRFQRDARLQGSIIN
ncbi:unnamed protein product, partial [Polarella glacialis]